MKLLLLFTLLFVLSTATVDTLYCDNSNKAYIHPSFKTLLMIYPRSQPIHNPQVPRISAEQAYLKYMKAKTVLFSTGNLAHQHHFPGAFALPEGKEMSASILKSVKNIKGKYIILFCD